VAAQFETSSGTVDALAEIAVFDRNGDSVLLDGCWREQAAVLVFVRHFG